MHNSQFIRNISCISSYMFRLVYRAIFSLVFGVFCMYNCSCLKVTLLSKHQQLCMTILFYISIPHILNIKARSCDYCCSGTAINIKYSGCVSVALVFQLAKRVFHVMLSSVTSPALQQFSTLSHKRHDFLKKLLNITRIS